MTPIDFNPTFFSLNSSRKAKNLKFNQHSQYAFNSLQIISSLSKDYVLPGHHGCVNTVNFSEYGDFLLSGSDDLHLNIYDVQSEFKLRSHLRTGHELNIFKAKFLYHCNSSKIISTACDYSLFYTEVNFPEEAPTNRFNCHTSIPFEVIFYDFLISVLEGEPFVFLVCSTEGSVRQYDIREKTSCRCSHCQRDVVIHISTQINSMDICPTRPYECLLALADNSVQFYDRRRTFTSARSYDCGFSAGMFMLDTRKSIQNSYMSGFSSVRYSSDGTEFLCNFIGDRVTVISCDFSEQVELTQPYLSHSQCYSRSSYFDACASGTKRSFSERDLDYSESPINGSSKFKENLDQDFTPSMDEVEPETNNSTRDSAELYDWFLSRLSFPRPLNGGFRMINDIRSKMPPFVPHRSESFTGHSNIKTILKEAIFWGKRFIMTGSDCGHVFIWDRKKEKVVQLLKGDRSIVNSLSHHPVDPILACSGIDDTIKIFRPKLFAPTLESEISRFVLQEHRNFGISSGDSDSDSDHQEPRNVNSHVFTVFFAPVLNT